MSAEKVKTYLSDKGLESHITIHEETIDTVEHAAEQIGCSEAEIAKTLSFIVDDKPVIVVMAGDGRVNSSKFKGQFHTKPHEQVGALGSTLTSIDVNITTNSGDIVLYNSSNIVIFYGSNTWDYTRLGKITDKTDDEITELLSNGDVTITIQVE